MCDYSLQAVSSRPAVVGEKLVTHDFGTGTRGFAPAGGVPKEAVCLLPGTELAFDQPIRAAGVEMREQVGRFRQINCERPCTHHDAIELSNGQVALLTFFEAGQMAVVLQLPAAPKTEAEREEQRRVEYAG